MTAGTVTTDRRVSSFELFFDLVFVFALTQVTASMAHDLSWTGLAHGLLIFAVLWWAWGSYAWLTDAVETEGEARLVLLGSMAAMLVVALAVPTAWDGSGPAFALGYLAVMILHGVLFAIAGERRDVTRTAIIRMAPTNLLPGLLLLAAGYTEGAVQAVAWVAAVIATYAGPYVFGMEGWQVDVPHFVERHSLILLIALGESIVAIGAGATGTVDVQLATSALLAIALASGLWWAYFTGEADLGEEALRETTGVRQAILARDIYSYLHIPLTVGIVLAALGIKLTIGHPDEPLHEVGAVGLCAGVAIFYAALAAIHLRVGARLNPVHVVAAAGALVVIPLALEVNAIWALATLAVVTTAAAVARSHDRFAGSDPRA
jgi:low temperature requirement protein LtrA